MKWSWKLGTVAGIGVFVHATFFILVVWIGLATWAESQSLATALTAIAFVGALFGCIVLHELGHALTARRYDIPTRDITLLPIGGVARLERMPDQPRQELAVALAGPAVNLVIAVGLGGLLVALGAWDAAVAPSAMEGPFAQRLVVVNLLLAVFNLVPAFPMDGGRVLRALLAGRMDYVAATQVAANVGQALAFVLGLVGLFFNPFLVFIALFVWIGAAAESNLVAMRSALAGIPVARAMLREFRVLDPGDTLAHAASLTLRGSQKDFPVVRDGAVVGVLTQRELLGALARGNAEAAVATAVEGELRVADSHEMLEGVLSRLHDGRGAAIPVTHEGELVGLLTLDNVGEFLQIEAALGKQGTDDVATAARDATAGPR